MRQPAQLAQGFLLTVVTCAPLALAQTYPDHLVDAPFTARWSKTTSQSGKTGTTSGIMARASDGSTYMSFSEPAFPMPGGTFRIEIDDLKNNRHITLYPGSSGHYAVMTPPGGQFRTFSLQKTAEMLQQLQDSYARHPDRPKPDGQTYVTPLGTRQQDGITLFGHKTEFTSSKGDKRTEEMWDSDLGIVVSNKTVWPLEDKETVMTVTDIRRVDPDPALFQIPDAYHPPPGAPVSPTPLP